MAEHDKAWFLKELIRLEAFATSASGLAFNLDYKGKNQVYRLLDGTAKGGSIEEMWRRIREKYGLTDEEICEYVNVVATAHELWKEVRDKAAELKVDVKVLAEQTLHALLLRDEKGMRQVLCLADWERLLDYSREHPMEYAQLIVIYYILYNEKKKAFRGKVAVQGKELLEQLYEHMQALQPENTMLREMADAYRSELEQMTEDGNLWTNSLRPTFLVQSFTDPNFRINTLSMLRLLPIPTDSLWMEPESLKKFASSAFIFFEVEPEGATGGRYDCIEVDAELADKNLVARRCFAFWMMEPEAGETHSLAFVQFRDERGQKQIVRYLYEYDSERQILHLEPLDADSPACVSFPMPQDLHWIDERHPLSRDERLWIAWYMEFMEANEDRLCIEMMKTDGVVLVEDYDIVDVAISRKRLTVTISNGEEVADFWVELENHPGLKHVTPMMDVAIFRHEDDQQLYLEWISPHISLPMKAFHKTANEVSDTRLR